jgi:hypothetical protein
MICGSNQLVTEAARAMLRGQTFERTQIRRAALVREATACRGDDLIERRHREASL